MYVLPEQGEYEFMLSLCFVAHCTVYSLVRAIEEKEQGTITQQSKEY